MSRLDIDYNSISDSEDEALKLFSRRVDAASALIETTCFPEKFPDLYSSPEQVLEKLNAMGLGEWTQQGLDSSTDTWENPEWLYSYGFILTKNEKVLCSAGVYLNEVVRENLSRIYDLEDEIRDKNVVITDLVSLFATSGTALSKEYTSLQEPGACLKNW